MREAASDEKRTVSVMSNDEFNREMNYQITMSYVKQFRNSGAVSDDEYKQIDEIMLKRHRPILGALLSGNSLI